MNMNICYKPFKGAESTASGCPSDREGCCNPPDPPLWFIRERRCAMSDYQILMLVFTVIGIVIAAIKSNSR